MISRTGQYAIRALVYLAATEETNNVTAGEIADATGLPPNYLTKILNTLTQEGLLTSLRGPHGGFHLVVSPAELTLATVLAAFHDAEQGDCLLGSQCRFRRADERTRTPCRSLASKVRRFIESTTIADLAGCGPGAGEYTDRA